MAVAQLVGELPLRTPGDSDSLVIEVKWIYEVYQASGKR